MARVAIRTAAAAAVFAAILGFSRFSFGLLLPAIKAELRGSYSAYGLIASANFAGYLAGTLVVPRLLKAWSDARIWNGASLVVMAVAMFATSLAATLSEVTVLRFIVGICSGIAAILTIALTLNGVEPRIRGFVSGGIWAGGGLGLGICGAFVDPHAHLGWRVQYAAMAAISLAAIVAFVALPMDRIKSAVALPSAQIRRWSGLSSRLAVAYALFGFGYIVYMVYASAYLLGSGMPASALASAWMLFGLGGAIGALLWGKLFDRFPSPLVLACALLVCACGVIFNVPFITGMAVFGTPTIVSALARNIAGDESYTKMLSLLTASFGIGQIAGPLGAGFVIDRTGLASGIPVTAAPLVLAATLLCWHRAR